MNIFLHLVHLESTIANIEALKKIEKLGNFEPFEFLSLLATAASAVANLVRKHLRLLKECGSLSLIKIFIKDFHEEVMEALISPFQKRAEILSSNGRSCCVAGCKNGLILHSGGLGFCEEHTWVYDTHVKRHSSDECRLPVLLLVWDRTPYRHALAAANELHEAFEFVERIWKSYMDARDAIIDDLSYEEMKEWPSEEEDEEEWDQEDEWSPGEETSSDHDSWQLNQQESNGWGEESGWS